MDGTLRYLYVVKERNRNKAGEGAGGKGEDLAGQRKRCLSDQREHALADLFDELLHTLHLILKQKMRDRRQNRANRGIGGKVDGMGQRPKSQNPVRDSGGAKTA